MRMSRVVPVVMCLVACGGGGKAKPDAQQIFDDAPMIDTPPPPPGCDYGELNDTTNDYYGGGFAEQTNLTFNDQLVMCGKINNGHYVADKQRVDVDSYMFQVEADTDVMLILTAAPGAEMLDSVVGYVADTESTYASAVYFDHGVGITSLSAGTYELDLEVFSSADAPAPIDYKLKLVKDMPAARCTKVTATPNYVENKDGATNNGNDVYQIVFSPSYMVTETAANDGPEGTSITVAPDTAYRISGVHAAVDPMDEYMDRDTYKFTTDANTNQMSIRLNWPGTTSDLDFIVFNEASTNQIAEGWLVGNQEDEFTTFAVKPNTTYWLWVGMYDGSTAPITYDLSLCGETFTP